MKILNLTSFVIQDQWSYNKKNHRKCYYNHEKKWTIKSNSNAMIKVDQTNR